MAVSQPGDDVSAAAAAAILGVSPEVLPRWEQRFGAPSWSLAPDGQHRYDREEIEELALALCRSHSIGAALESARSRSTGEAR